MQKISLLIKKYTRNGTKPAVWTIPNHDYDETGEWTGLHIPEQWLVKTTAGNKLLIVEADASVGEQALALGAESANDLDVQEVSQAADSLKVILEIDKVKAELVTILLTDSQKQIGRNENGEPYNLRQQNDALHHIDIIIDAKAPLIGAILNWAKEVANPQDKSIVFVTSNDTYFETIKQALGNFGYHVIRWSPKDIPQPSLPHLVYENITADTMDTTRRLIENGKVEGTKCCPLIDRQSGLDKYDRLKSDLKKQNKSITHNICSAQIYSDLFRLVRFWLRLGYNREVIQLFLDSEWKNIFGTVSPNQNNS